MGRVEKPDVPLGKVSECFLRFPVAFLEIVLDVPIFYEVNVAPSDGHHNSIVSTESLDVCCNDKPGRVTMRSCVQQVPHADAFQRQGHIDMGEL